MTPSLVDELASDAFFPADESSGNVVVQIRPWLHGVGGPDDGGVVGLGDVDALDALVGTGAADVAAPAALDEAFAGRARVGFAGWPFFFADSTPFFAPGPARGAPSA